MSTVLPLILTDLPDRRRLAERIFLFAVATNLALTVFALLAAFTGIGQDIAGNFVLSGEKLGQLLFSIVVFNGIWALIWYGVKNRLLKSFVGFTPEQRRATFSSRMTQPFDLPGLLAQHSERRIRIVDMIGRRGRFITLAMVMFYFLYADIAKTQSGNFTSAFTSQALLDAVITNWLFIALYRADGFLGAVFYGAQTRVMDGTLARANCLLIVTLWALFKFTLIPIGAELQALYSPQHFALLFALIWGTYLVVDTLAEVGGSLYGTMKIRVRGVGDVNRKSIAGTATGLIGGLLFSVGMVLLNQMPAAWVALAVTVAIASSALELFSPRGTDDFTMATGNALICWAFGAWLLAGG
jgi:hypothetical protein